MLRCGMLCRGTPRFAGCARTGDRVVSFRSRVLTLPYVKLQPPVVWRGTVGLQYGMVGKETSGEWVLLFHCKSTSISIGLFCLVRPSPKVTSSTASFDSQGGRGVFSSTVIPLARRTHKQAGREAYKQAISTEASRELVQNSTRAMVHETISDEMMD